MARIRSIKPELLEDEKTATLSDRDWRVFVSLFLLADDYGNLRGEPGLIHGKATWGAKHPISAIEEAIASLEEIGLLVSYVVRGQRYLHIKGWSKHQKIDHPGKPAVPGPDDPEHVEARQWFTYFLRLGEDGPIKIGKTIDIAARISKLQVASPAPLVLLRSVPRNIETECHRKFAHLRTHGEWFSPKAELLEFISGVADSNDSRTIREPIANDSRLIGSDLIGSERRGSGGPPAPAVPASELWAAGDWLRAFKAAWTKKYHLTYGGGQAAGKACGVLSDALADLPAPERIEAQALAPAMLAAYFADPSANKQKHPFHWFVERFDSLRATGPPGQKAASIYADLTPKEAHGT